MDSARAAHDEVYVYAMSRPGFPLQHVADAFAVQTAGPHSSRIGVVFGLIGLYLRVERQYSGRQVQEAHMTPGRPKRNWPELPLPDDRGAITAEQVLAAPAGPARDAAIDDWCRSVWTACSATRPAAIALLSEYS